ncbi:hypothetical protein RUND412_004240 [Rhizina undulata]
MPSSAPNGSFAARSQQTPLASQRVETERAPQRTAWFPLGYKEGFCQWWAAISPDAAEAAVLGFLPFNKPPPATSPAESITTPTTDPPQVDRYGPRACTSTLVPLSGKNRLINEFSITRTAENDPENHIVMLHGYGAGLAFFYKNYDALSRLPGWKLWALDLLGYGRSSRPPFVIHAKDPQGKITEAENWFIDALEEWREKRGIERFTLMGHSFGGYLAVRYALKYKDRVNKLILVSPVGVPEDPYAVRTELPDANTPNPSNSGLANEFTQDQEEIVTGSNPDLPSTNLPGNASTTSLPTNGTESKKPIRRPTPKWLNYLWDANVSPFSFVRWSGPLGPRLVSGWTTRRFSHLPVEESQALHNYAYSLFRQRGSGEYALAYVLAPGAYARRPLIWRIQDLVKSARGGIPSVWMYGDRDWMDIAGGYAAEEKIRNEEVGEAAGWTGGSEWRGEKQGRGGEAKVLVVRDAGHHLYLDGAEEFNRMIVGEMRDVEKRESRRRDETRN